MKRVICMTAGILLLFLALILRLYDIKEEYFKKFFTGLCKVEDDTLLPEPQKLVLSDTTTISIIFTGDFMQHMPQIIAAQKGNGTFDYSDNFKYIAPWWQDADFVVVNFETTLTNDSFSGYPQFASPIECAKALRSAGVSGLVMANNHCCDKGRAGAVFTTSVFDSLGFERTGMFVDSTDYFANHPMTFDTCGIKIAIFNYTYGTNGLSVPKGMIVNTFDTVKIAKDLARFKDCDARILCLHWGDEYVNVPNKFQQSFAKWCLEHGCNVIIGSHPHVVQSVEKIFDKDSVLRGVVAYSLGNLISNQRKRYQDGGVNLKLIVNKAQSKDVSFKVEIMPCWVYKGVDEFTIVPTYARPFVKMGIFDSIRYEQFVSDVYRVIGTS